MTALLLNYLRRSWLIGVLACVAVAAFQVIANRVFIQINPDGADLSPLTRLIPEWVQSAFNVGPASMSDVNGFFAMCYQHPFLMVVLLAMPVALITGWLSGDVEKRTIALVLSRPVGRFQIVAAAAIVALVWCALAIISAWAGCLAGANWTGEIGNIDRQGLFQATLNLAGLIFAFSGIAAAASTMISVRGDAVGWCLTIILVMYVWNFLAQIWYGGGGATNYSLFRFYQPTDILLHGRVDPNNLVVLGAVGLAGWIVAAVTFRFRNFNV